MNPKLPARHRTAFRALSATALIASLAACSSMPWSSGANAPGATAPLQAKGGSQVGGTILFSTQGSGLRVVARVTGLKPGQEHGFHIHEKGDCGDNGNASGGHFNPTGGTHGKFSAPGSHAGELPSLVADANGVARFSVDVHTISLTEGAANNVVGRALVVHRDRDDFTTQPAGNSGPRTACAVIARR